MSLIPTDFFGGRRVGGSIFDLWDPFSNITPSADTAALANTRIDWRETADAHVFTADLPGVRKDEVKVEVEDGYVLRISGEKAKEKEEKTDTWHRVERCSGQFLRKFRLPENAKVDEVRAALENGVLTVTIPKVEERKTDVKSITVS